MTMGQEDDPIGTLWIQAEQHLEQGRPRDAQEHLKRISDLTEARLEELPHRSELRRSLLSNLGLTESRKGLISVGEGDIGAAESFLSKARTLSEDLLKDFADVRDETVQQAQKRFLEAADLASHGRYEAAHEAFSEGFRPVAMTCLHGIPSMSGMCEHQ